MNCRWMTSVPVLLSLWMPACQPAVVLAQASGEAARTGMKSLLVLVLFLTAAWFVRRWMKNRSLDGGGRSELRILEVLAVSPRQRLILLQLERRRFLLGAGTDGVSLLKEWQEDA